VLQTYDKMYWPFYVCSQFLCTKELRWRLRRRRRVWFLLRQWCILPPLFFFVFFFLVVNFGSRALFKSVDGVTHYPLIEKLPPIRGRRRRRWTSSPMTKPT
jgi:hypothetical protein